MANYCRGEVSIQGDYDVIERFVNEVLLHKNEVMKTDEYDGYTIKAKTKMFYNHTDCVYSNTLNVYDTLIHGDISSRYYFKTDEILDLAKKYCVDIFIVASDVMRGLMQVIRVIDGKLEINYEGNDKSLLYKYDSNQEFDSYSDDDEECDDEYWFEEDDIPEDYPDWDGDESIMYLIDHCCKN